MCLIKDANEINKYDFDHRKGINISHCGGANDINIKVMNVCCVFVQIWHIFHINRKYRILLFMNALNYLLFHLNVQR